MEYSEMNDKFTEITDEVENWLLTSDPEEFEVKYNKLKEFLNAQD